VWASDEGPSVQAASAGLPRGDRPDNRSSQITSPLNGPVNFLKSLNADV